MSSPSLRPAEIQNTGYIPSLDGVRGIALVLVVLIHGTYGFLKGGWIGVDLFFILSGYLITSLLQKEYSTTGSISLKSFYWRRILRLFPPLVICLVITNVLWNFIPDAAKADRFIAALASLFYFANLVPDLTLGPLGHMWSLSVEEHFYIVWPLLTSVVIFKTPFRSQILLVSILLCATMLFRLYVYNSHTSLFPDPENISYRFTLCRVDSIILGALLALVLAKTGVGEQNKGSNVALFLILAGLVGILFFLDSKSVFWRDGGFVLTNLLCLSFVFFAIKNPINSLLSNNALRWLGRRSYGIYVYHMPIFMAFEGFRVQHSPLNLLLVTIARIVAAGIVAELSFRFVEQPILKYKNSNRFKSKAAVVLAEPGVIPAS